MVSVISSTWMLVGGPGGPDRWRSQAGEEERKDRGTDGGRGGGGDCKSGGDGKMLERVTVVLAPAATVAKSVKPLGAVWYN